MAGLITPFTSGGRLYGAKINNIDELKASGIYSFYSGDLSGTIPTNIGNVGFVIVYGYSEKRLTQMLVCYNGKTYTRGINTEENVWSDWKRIDNFGYNTLDELAAALKSKLGL